MMRLNVFIALAAAGISAMLLSSCGGGSGSNTTGWEYNAPYNGGFEVVPYTEQITGPGLVLIEGGTFVMGNTQDDFMYDWNNIPRRVTVSSFYMDETEVRNLDYLEYIYWLRRVFGMDYPEVIADALPDTLVWRDRLAYNEPFVELYFRHPAYRDYPVVGVSWPQANDYCTWRTDRVNEMMLIEAGILDWDPDQLNENNFNTQAYLAGQYEGLVLLPLEDLNPNGPGERKARIEDGIMLPKYRLPTEAEWEFAALGLIGNALYERIIERRIYPWNGNYTRFAGDDAYGTFMANFKRGRGDNMGVAGALNDAADITAPVYSYWPNDYGLYNMAGNVAEWVMDVYRPLSAEDVDDFRPFRGNVFKTKAKDEEGYLMEKDSLGRLIYREVTVEEAAGRRNYRKADNRNYLDGDYASTVSTDWLQEPTVSNTTSLMYEYGVASMINDEARVYKGGSWRDRAYWLSPGARRFIDQNLATDYIGFRCAMTRVGSPIPGAY